MPLGAARISFLAKTQVTAVAEVIRKQLGVIAYDNAQIDTAQSKFGGASGLFDGTGDYLDVTGTDGLWTTNDDFTFETWIRMAALPATSQFFMLTGGIAGKYISLYRADASTLQISVALKGAAQLYQRNPIGTLPSTNTWYHLAVVKNGSDLKMFWDGTELTTIAAQTGTMTSDKTFLNDSLKISRWNSASYYVNGHLDETRISLTNRYTGNFTPSTTPFTNDADTFLLLHYDGTDGSTTFVDDNGTGRAQVGVSAVNGAQISTAQSKFGGTSAYFDRSSAYYLSVGNDNNTLDPGSGDFTYECWFRADTLPGSGTYHFIYDARTTGTGTQLSFGLTNQRVFFYTAGAFRINGTTVLSTATWYHLALVKSGSTTTLYLDGSSEGTYSDSNTYTARTNPIIGANFNAANAHDGYLDEFRISDSARYTTSFTPSTTPFVNDSDTLLLLHMDGTNTITSGNTFIDDNGKGRSRVSLRNENQFQIDTANYKFGGSSGLFDGSNDRVRGTMYPSLGTSEFTFECWLNFTDANGGGLIQIGNVGLYLRSDEKLGLYDTGTSSAIIPTGSTVLSTSTWYHIAVTRASDNYCRIWINGSLDVTSTSTYTSSIGGDILLGELNGTVDLLGHLDEVRISDTARYTAAFTAPTAPFQNDANTKLLIHFNGTDGSLDIFDDNGVY